MIEEAFGVIPLRWHEKEWEVLLICHQAGHWGFPKGRPDGDEPWVQTAERELFEETGLTIKERWEPIFEEHYSFRREGKKVEKTVRFFLAEVEGEVVLQESEIQASCWTALNKVKGRLTFSSQQQLFEQAKHIIKTRSGIR